MMNAEEASRASPKPPKAKEEGRMQNAEIPVKATSMRHQSHTGAKAEGRMQNDEGSGKETQSAQSHPKAC
jgi:hypothetical protein